MWTSIDSYIQAFTIHEEMGNKQSIVISPNNIGCVYKNLGDFSKAIDYHVRSLGIREEIGDKQGISNSLTNIGNAYGDIGDFSKAIEYHKRSLGLKEEIGDKRGIAISLVHIGETYATKEYTGYDTAKAIEYLLKALGMAEEISSKELIFYTHNSLSDIFEQMGDTAKGLEHFKKYHEIEREVHSEEVAKKNANLEQKRQMDLVQKEQEVTERILSNILPKSIAERIKHGETRIADRFDDVTVLFSDIVNFTNLSFRRTPEELVQMLDDIFSEFDSIAEKHRLEKIKTIGNAYMVVSGVPEKREDHAEAMMLMALDMQNAVTKFQASISEDLAIRIGIHTGSVVAGVIGKKKFAYDMWGDAVNVASRMESHGKPNTIHVTEAIVKKLEGKATFEKRGEISIKGKGKMTTYFLQAKV